MKSFSEGIELEGSQKKTNRTLHRQQVGGQPLVLSKNWDRFHHSNDIKNTGWFCLNSGEASIQNSCIQGPPPSSKQLLNTHLKAMNQPTCLHECLGCTSTEMVWPWPPPFLQSFQGPNQDCEAFIHCCWAAAFIKTKPQVDFHIVCCTMTQQRIEGKYNQLPTPNFLNVYDRRTITMESQRYYLLLVMTARTEHRMPFECRKASLQFPEFLQPCFTGQDDPLPCSMLIYTGDKLHWAEHGEEAWPAKC